MQKNTTTSRPPTEQKIALQFNQESPLTVIVNETVPHRTTLHSVLSCQKSFKKIIYCDSTSLSTAQDLLSQLSRHTTAFSPSTNKKIKQQLTSIIKDFQQQDHRFLFVITQSEKLSLDVIAAFAHLSLLQEQSSLVMPIILCGTSTTHEKVCLIQPQHLHLFQLSHLTYTQRSPASFKTLISTFNIKQWLDNFISNTKPITITLSIAFTILCGGFLFSPLHSHQSTIRFSRPMHSQTSLSHNVTHKQSALPNHTKLLKHHSHKRMLNATKAQPQLSVEHHTRPRALPS